MEEKEVFANMFFLVIKNPFNVERLIGMNNSCAQGFRSVIRLVQGTEGCNFLVETLPGQPLLSKFRGKHHVR